MLPKLALTIFFFSYYVSALAGVLPRQLLPGLITDSEPEDATSPATSAHAKEAHTTPLDIPILSSISEKASKAHDSVTRTHSPVSTMTSVTEPLPLLSTTSETTPTTTAPPSHTPSSTTYNTAPPTTHIGTTTSNDDHDAHTSPDASSMKQGKIVGITVLCIVIAVVLTMILGFFDTWWGYLKGVITGKRKGDDSDLSEDWEKKRSISWLGGKGADADGVYQQGYGSAVRVDLPTKSPTLPSPTYAAWDDPHPLDPLYRRPSERVIPPYIRPFPY